MKCMQTLFAILVVCWSAVHGQSVVISEIGWMGTTDLDVDEWMELYNASDNPVDLSNWTLKAVDGTPSILLVGVIPGHGFFLLERTDDTTISDSPANQIYSGALGNSGEHLQLKDNNQVIMDSVNCTAGWFAGANTLKISMERRHPNLNGSQAASWANNTITVRNGLNANSLPINGTPGQPNSVYDSSLPVELELFTVRWQEGVVVLDWCVQSQLNNYGYKVMRCEKETGPFQCISGLIPGAGTTSERQKYHFCDERASSERRYWYQLQQIDLDGRCKVFGAVSVFTGERDPFVPKRNHLAGGYPNPFNPGVTLVFELANPAVVDLRAVDVLGRCMRIILDHRLLDAGRHSSYWDGHDAAGQSVANGVYFIQLWTDSGERFVSKLAKCN
jgi:hypothetical protein